MCVAVIKPIGADLPTEIELRNCFVNNPHGAGYMFLNNGMLHIKKGFMDFDSFYKSFCDENFSKDDPIFIHFRIATHGLVDEGNTHPFPITQKISSLRSTEFTFKGYGLMHNGVFLYDKSLYDAFDQTNVISDTMLFSMILSYYFDHQDNINIKNKYDLLVEEAISYSISSGSNEFVDDIERKIGYNKVAIMDSNGNIFKYGNWILHNGCFYSNSDYKNKYDFNYLNEMNCSYTHSDNMESICNVCGREIASDKMEWTTFGDVCKDCLESLPVFKCECCGCYDLISDKHENSKLCDICYSENHK